MNEHQKIEAALPTKIVDFLEFVSGVASFQVKACFYNVEDLMPVITIPLYTLSSLAVVASAGRADLAPYALVGVFLMTLTQLALFISGNILQSEERAKLLLLHLASPAHYGSVVLIRSLVISLLSLLGLIESYFIATLGFNIQAEIHHPYLFCITTVLTILCASAHGLLITGLLSMAKNPRAYQNIIGGPLYLLGGILVPTTYLPEWLGAASPIIFLYWSADLLRDCYQSGPPPEVYTKLSALVVILMISTFAGLKLFSNRVARLSNGGEYN